MTISELKKLVPQNKFDNSTIDKLMELNEIEIRVILPELFMWIADFNWPIAEEINRVLIKHPRSILPIIEQNLSANAIDEILKYWIIVKLIPQLPFDEQKELQPYVDRICNNPSDSEKYEEIVDVAKEYKEVFDRI